MPAQAIRAANHLSLNFSQCRMRTVFTEDGMGAWEVQMYSVLPAAAAPLLKAEHLAVEWHSLTSGLSGCVYTRH